VGVIGVMWKKVGMQNCIRQASIRLYPMQKIFRNSCGNGGAIDVGYDAIDPDA
jgi:hypothetical protein